MAQLLKVPINNRTKNCLDHGTTIGEFYQESERSPKYNCIGYNGYPCSQLRLQPVYPAVLFKVFGVSYLTNKSLVVINNSTATEA